MTHEEETEILLRAVDRLRNLGFRILAEIIEGIAKDLPIDETIKKAEAG